MTMPIETPGPDSLTGRLDSLRQAVAQERSWLDAGWMQTWTGRQVYPLAPELDDIVIEDIAHALSLICRYGGHVDRFYSVAEHCIHLSHAVDPDMALWALLHDATEAYVGDMIRPLKRSMRNYCAIEDRLMEFIAIRFQLPARWSGIPAPVKAADTRILLDERAALMAAPTPAPWDIEDMEPLGVEIQAWDPATAERLYLERFDQLMHAGSDR